jgi:UDP-glucose 4-epimerase
MTKLKFKKAIVTGGAGFIGSHITERLLNEGVKVIVIDDLSEGKWSNLPESKNLTKYEGSITEKNIGRLFKGVDVVFHLAALPRVQRSIKYPMETHEVNVTGTLNMLLMARDYGVKKFIFSSSSSVYGEQDKLPFTETMTPHPISPYGLHKLIGEEYCKLFSRLWGISTVCLRYFNVYGPRMYPDGAYANLLPKFIKLMRNGKIPIINGDGEQTRDFTYVSDVVNANLLAAESNLSGEVINIGSGKNISVNKVVGIINKLLGTNIKPIHGPAVIEPRSTLADRSKAKRLLGWEPKIELLNGIKTMIYSH